jgi:dephospho-CoA kinase
MLLITGPPGIGKSTALKMFAAIQNLQLAEWESPVDIDNSELGM